MAVTVVTLNTSLVRGTTAKFNGELTDMNGQAAIDCYFQYKITGAAEFRLYQDDALVATFAGDVREAPVTIYMVEYQHSFSMTAVDGWGRESVHSVPFVFDAPLLDAPGSFKFTF